VKYGLVFPQTSIGTDPIAIRDFAQATEGAGFDHMLLYDHVTGAHPSRFEEAGEFRPQNSGRTYIYEAPFHEPLTTIAWLAASTTSLKFVTSVLVLPMRQTVLVAKQVAQIDLLSGGRFTFLVGPSWNFTEYEALGTDFDTRGERMEEQIDVLRELWTHPLVSFEGRWHNLDRVGINPLPQRKIEVWIGCSARHKTLRRVAKYADGWMPLLIPPETPELAVQRLHRYLDEERRAYDSMKLIPRTYPLRKNADGTPADYVGLAKFWQSAGADQITIHTNTVDPEMEPQDILRTALDAKRVLEQEIG
jgi:probable F420-dependent oxidoreductase